MERFPPWKSATRMGLAPTLLPPACLRGTARPRRATGLGLPAQAGAPLRSVSRASSYVKPYQDCTPEEDREPPPASLAACPPPAMREAPRLPRPRTDQRHRYRARDRPLAVPRDVGVRP